MSLAAWIMLVVTWTVILSINAWLFLKVLRTPQRDPGEE